MEGIEQLLNTAGELDAIKLLLIISLVVAITLLVRERNTGKDKEREDKFRTDLLNAQREQAAADSARTERLINAFMKEIEAGRESVSEWVSQVSGKIETSKVAIEANSAGLKETREAVDMTNERVEEANAKLDALAESVNNIETMLAGSRQTEVLEALHTMQSTVEEIRQIIKEKQDVGSTDLPVSGTVGGSGIPEAASPQTPEGESEAE